VSGVDGTQNFLNGVSSQVVRWPSKISLVVSLDPNGNEKIFTPFLDITYQEKEQASIDSSTVSTVEFSTEYTMDTSSEWVTYIALFYTLLGVAVIFSIINVYVWVLTHPRIFIKVF
jgi:hypothetical protein